MGFPPDSLNLSVASDKEIPIGNYFHCHGRGFEPQLELVGLEVEF